MKTRDPVNWMRWDDEIKKFNTASDTYQKLIIHNPDERQDGMYGGINEKGVAIVATYVRSSELAISYLRRPYIRLLLEAASAKEAIKILQSFTPKICGNIFIADAQRCFGIEAATPEYFIEEIKQPSVKTNHFLHLPYRNLSFDVTAGFEQWSHQHQARAEELVTNLQNIEDCQALLSDRTHYQKSQAICTIAAEDPCYTHSGMVFDCADRCVYYAQGNPSQVPFVRHGF